MFVKSPVLLLILCRYEIASMAIKVIYCYFCDVERCIPEWIYLIPTITPTTFELTGLRFPLWIIEIDFNPEDIDIECFILCDVPTEEVISGKQIKFCFHCFLFFSYLQREFWLWQESERVMNVSSKCMKNHWFKVNV